MAILDIRGSGDRSYVFVHGSPSDRRVWEDLAALAPDDVVVVSIDLPDHGEAPDEPTASMAPLEHALMEAVKAASGEVTLVGHSLGAWLIAATSPEMPERVKRFVPISGMSRYAEEQLAMRREIAEQLESHQLDPASLEEALMALLLGPERTPELHARMEPMLDLSRERWIRIARRSLQINDRPPARIDRPTTVIHSTGDAAIPMSLGEELARLSDAELVSIETTSHMLPLTHANELAEIIYGERRHT